MGHRWDCVSRRLSGTRAPLVRFVITEKPGGARDLATGGSWEVVGRIDASDPKAHGPARHSATPAGSVRERQNRRGTFPTRPARPFYPGQMSLTGPAPTTRPPIPPLSSSPRRG